MSVTVDIQLSKKAEQALRDLAGAPMAAPREIAAAMDRQNWLTVAHIQRRYYVPDNDYDLTIVPLATAAGMKLATIDLDDLSKDYAFHTAPYGVEKTVRFKSGHHYYLYPFWKQTEDPALTTTTMLWECVEAATQQFETYYDPDLATVSSMGSGRKTRPLLTRRPWGMERRWRSPSWRGSPRLGPTHTRAGNSPFLAYSTVTW